MRARCFQSRSECFGKKDTYLAPARNQTPAFTGVVIPTKLPCYPASEKLEMYTSRIYFAVWSIASMRTQGPPVSCNLMIRLIQFVVSLTTGPQPLPKPVLHTVRPTVSSFNFQHPHIALRSFSSCLRLLLVFPSLLSLNVSFNNVLKAVPTHDVTNPVNLPYLCCMQDIPFLLDSM
jgi:hypothetical protein